MTLSRGAHFKVRGAAAFLRLCQPPLQLLHLRGGAEASAGRERRSGQKPQPSHVAPEPSKQWSKSLASCLATHEARLQEMVRGG